MFRENSGDFDGIRRPPTVDGNIVRRGDVQIRPGSRKAGPGCRPERKTGTGSEKPEPGAKNRGPELGAEGVEKRADRGGGEGEISGRS